MEQFCKGVHHALVVEEQKPLKMVSQMDIVEFLEKNLDHLPNVKSAWDKPINYIAQNNLISVEGSAPVIEALKVVSSLNIRAIPVINTGGCIVATFSASDFRGEYATLLKSSSSVTVMQFLLLHYNDKIPETVVSPSTNSIRTSVKLMLTNRVHRVWVRYPDALGVISLSDAIRSAFDAETV